MKKRKISAVIFDVDGTLIDTERIYMEGWRRSAKKQGFEMSEEYLLKTRATSKEIAVGLFSQYYPGRDYDTTRQYRVEFAEQIIAGTPLEELLKPGIPEVLDWLSLHGIKKATASTTGRAANDCHLKRAGIFDRFEATVAGDEITWGKPFPDIFLKAAKKLGVDPEECMVCEDSLSGMEAAAAAGMIPIFIEDCVPLNDKIRSIAYKTPKTLKELPEIIDQYNKGVDMEIYKECKHAANTTMEEAFAKFEPALSDFYRDALPYRMEPFRIFGNLYYVGNKKVCMHLIDTGAGLILFDTGYGNDFYLLLESIRTLGFDPHDVKIVIHSHGHFDHMNGGKAMRELFGSKIYMSRVDSDLIEEMPSRALSEYGPGKYFDDWCVPDVRIDDGQVITLGNTSVRCVLTPGHTFGTMTYFFDAVDETGKKLKVGYMGGCGFLTVYKKYCEKYGLPQNKLEKMGESIRKVYDEPVDIVIGNHPGQNCTIEKREWWLAHPEKNPFINPEAWHIFLDELEAKRRSFIAEGYY